MKIKLSGKILTFLESTVPKIFFDSSFDVSLKRTKEREQLRKYTLVVFSSRYIGRKPI